MPIKLFSFLLCFCFFNICDGQTTVKDSLIRALKNTDIPREQATLHGDLAVYFYNTQMYYDSAYYYNERAYEIANKNNLKNDEARAFFNFGLIYSKLREYDKALDSYKNAYEIFTDVGTTSNLSAVNSSIAALYFEKGDYKEAETYFKKAVELSKKQNDLLSLAIDYVNLGQTEYMMDNFLKSKLYLEDGIQLLEELNYPISAARIYYGNTLLKLGRKREARMQAEIGYDLAIKENNVEYISDANKLLYELSLENEEYKTALEFYRKHIIYKDSLNAAREINNIEKLRLNFNLSQKENDFKQLSKNKMYLTAIYILLGIGIILLIIFINNQRKIARITSSMHDVQTKLVGDELSKRNTISPDKADEKKS